ncbi:hypothetical protein B0O80DRAFT_507963 [Mortierella sp. GBAus27b]|nr:hypothetical protein B0O80DRAFT_507963 [Mortierella sp. GBAus27b]
MDSGDQTSAFPESGETMGVEGAWQFLEKNGIEKRSVDPKSFEGHVHVDTLSLIRAYIVATEHYILQEQHRKAQTSRLTEQQQDEQRGVRLARSVHHRLAESFDQARVTLHFDGAMTMQKELAHQRRTQQHESLTRKAQASILKTQLLISPPQVHPFHGNTPTVPPSSPASGNITTFEAVNPTSSKRTKVIRSFKKAQNLSKSARTLATETKAQLTERLEGFGWRVHKCEGESDVCISNQSGRVVVATSDSDFLFHKVDVILRQDPQKRSKYHLIDIQSDVLGKLDISADAWAVVGAVSRNDYSVNIPGCSLQVNFHIMKSVDSNLAPDDMLLEYCETVSVVQGLTEVCQTSQFGRSRDIFFDRHESLVETPRSTNTGLDNDMRGMLGDLQGFLRQYHDVREQKKSRSSPVTVSCLPAPSSATTPLSSSSAPSSSQARVTPSPKGSGRGYLKMVPGNNFRAKEYIAKESAVAVASSSQTPQPKAKPRTNNRKRKRKTLYDPSSRKKRLDPSKDNNTVPSRTNRLKPATVIQNSLTKYATITMDCGTLSTQLKKGLSANNVGEPGKRDQFRKEILDVVNEMIRIGTEATRCAEQAISLYIAKITAEFPSLDREDIARRKEHLQFLGYWSNISFFGNLLQEFYSWHDKDKGKRTDNASNTCIKAIVRVYSEFLERSGSDVPILKSKIESGLAPFLQLAGTRLADTLQIHFSRNISELVERIKNHNHSWAHGEGRLILAGIDKDGKSKDHDPISLFWILNSHLPASQQMKFVPEGGFTDKFFTITEYALSTVLFREGSSTAKNMLGKGFETQTKAREHTNNHPGDLCYRLFFSKSLDYTRGVCLTDPDPSLSPSLALLNGNGETAEEYKNLKQSMEDAADTSYNAAKDALKEFIHEQLIDPAIQKSLLDQGTDKRKYVLRGSIVTNGHELKVLAYSLIQACPSPSYKKKPNTTRSKLVDVKTMMAETSADDIFGEHMPRTVIGIDPGIKSTATCCVLSTDGMNGPKNITITQGSHTFTTKQYLKGLEHAKKKAGVHELEQKITPVECSEVEAGQQGSAWVQLRHSIEEHVGSVLQVQESLRQFYRTQMFKIKTFHRKQALGSVINKGIDRVVAAAGCNGKPGADSPRPLFVVGDGDFGVRKGELLYQQFISTLKKKTSGAHRWFAANAKGSENWMVEPSSARAAAKNGIGTITAPTTSPAPPSI